MSAHAAEPLPHAPASGSAAPALRWLLGPWAAGLLGCVCFLSSLPNGLTYDDVGLIQHNARIEALTDWRGIWLSDWWRVELTLDGPAADRDRLYRPLTVFSFALNYAVHGRTPFGYHLVNVLLHGGVCMLVWHLTRRLLRDDAVAGVTALIYAVHPIHAEAVANVVGRAEVLATLLIIAGLLVLRAAKPAAAHALWRAPVAALTFLAALLSKETAICYPALAVLVVAANGYILPLGCPRCAYRNERRAGYCARCGAQLHEQTTTRLNWRGWLWLALWLLIPLVIYFPVRYEALGGHLIRPGPPNNHLNPLASTTVGGRLIGAGTVLGHYARLLFVPDRLCSDYGLAVIDPQAGFTALTAVGIAAAAAALIAVAGVWSRAVLWRQLALVMALAIASYGLISNVIILIGVTLAERLMYWPSVPLLMAVALLVMAGWRALFAADRPLAASAGLVRLLGLGLLAALALRTTLRNTDWYSNETLFNRDAAVFPLQRVDDEVYSRSVQLNAALGCLNTLDALKAAPDRRFALLTRADRYFQAALHLDPAYAEALAYRGYVAAQLGRPDLARQYLESALVLRPQDAETRRLWASLPQATSAPALEALRVAVATQPTNAAVQRELAAALLSQGDYAAAREVLDNVLSLTPDDPAALRDMAKLYLLQGTDAKPARPLLEQALQLAPNDWQTHALLVSVIGNSDPTAALRHAQRAFDLQPNDVRNAINLAEAHVLNNRFEDAIALYRRIQRGLSADDPLHALVTQRIGVLRGR